MEARRDGGSNSESRAGVKDPVAAYHALLEDERLAATSAEQLATGQREGSLMFGERPLCVAIRPQLMTRRRYERAVAAAEGVHSALAALEKAVLRDEELRRELGLEPEEERLALADPGFTFSSPSVRLDSFFADEVRFVEYNAESPAGMAYSDNLAAIFARLPVMKAFRKQFRGSFLPTRRRQLGAMLHAFKQWGKGTRPVIAIVDWNGLPTAPEFEMFKSFFEASGVKTVICDPRSLELRRGRLYAQGSPVNLVYRRVLTSELLARGDETRVLCDAYVAGAVCVVNSFRAKLLHKKMSLALLSDERYQRLYTPAQRAAIRRHVPWTRKVRPELAEEIARRRETLVLKPNDEYGGKGGPRVDGRPVRVGGDDRRGHHPELCRPGGGGDPARSLSGHARWTSLPRPGRRPRPISLQRPGGWFHDAGLGGRFAERDGWRGQRRANIRG